MKKLFTILLMMAVVMGVSAQTHMALASNKAMKEMRSFKKLNATEMGRKAMAKDIFTYQTKVQKKVASPYARTVAPKASMQQPKKAVKKAAANVIPLVITKSFTYEWYALSSDWYFGGTTDDGEYVVRLDYIVPSEADRTGLFTEEDLDPDYSYMSHNGQTIRYTEVSFTVSGDNPNAPQIHGTLVGDNGVTYELRVETSAAEPRTVDIVDDGSSVVSINYYDFDSDWYIKFDNGSTYFYLDVIDPDKSFNGTYTEADIEGVESYNSFNIDGTTEHVKTMNLTFACDNVRDIKAAFSIKGTVVTDKNTTINLDIEKKPAKEAKETKVVQVDVKKAEWPSENIVGGCYFELTDKADATKVYTVALKGLSGDFTTDGFVGTLTTAPGTTFNNGTAHLDLNTETNVVSATVEMVMEDEVKYQMSFSTPVEMVITDLEFSNLAIEEMSFFGINVAEASNDEYSFEAYIFDDVPGVYDSESMSVYMEGADGTEIESVAIISAESTLDATGSPVLDVMFIGDNGITYNVHAYFTVPEVADEMTITVEGAELTDLRASLGAWQLSGQNADKSAFASIVIANTDIPGTYTMEDTGDYATYNYIDFIDAGGSLVEEAQMYAMNLTVTQDAEGRITATGDVQAGAHLVHLTMVSALAGEIVKGDQYDAEEEIDVVFAKDDLVELDLDDEEGFAYVSLSNADRNDTFSTLVYLDSFDSVIGIPEGTYEINQTYRAPSVQPGAMEDSSVYPTFYGLLTGDGYISVPLWLATSGTLTVKNVNGELSFELNAKNTWLKTMHVVYNPTVDGINEVNLHSNAVKKVLENNQIIIKKNGKRYNVVGAEM